jgi:hypothetical protein
MDRRRFLLTSLAGAIAGPLAAGAQPEKAVRIGVLRPAPDGPVFRQMFEPFQQALRARGFLEGTNLRVRAGSPEEMLALACERGGDRGVRSVEVFAVGGGELDPDLRRLAEDELRRHGARP